MRPIHWVTLDKRRPALVLTRPQLVGRMSSVTIAPITTRAHGLSTELSLDARNGLDGACVAKCDQITAIEVGRLHDQCGWLLESQESALRDAIHAAFDLS